MIERVARAIWADRYPDWNWDSELRDHVMRRADMLGHARAAIEVMRTPTDAMLGAANRLNHPRDADIWRAMIDAAVTP